MLEAGGGAIINISSAAAIRPRKDIITYAAAKAGLNAMTEAFAADQLRSFITRIERLEEDKSALAADIREVYAEAKGAGFDAGTLRQVVRMRKMDPSDRRRNEELLDLYKRALDL